ncbi:MAG: hypothetical protein SGI73_04955 [Chloroflexota bacterium]|nr:hypothetical protein [Chloroflexota bacterium]
MKILTEDAFLACGHRVTSRVQNKPNQPWVTINGKKILVEPDPVGWKINNCPLAVSPSSKPCVATLKNNAGYSTFINVGGHPLCLDTIMGLSDGVPPADYLVVTPGQDWVNAAE